MTREEQVGERFGRLVVVEEMEMKRRWQRRVLVRCDCGTEKGVRLTSLTSGNTKSCGCLQKELIALRGLVHGHTARKVITSEYAAWRAMLQRCLNARHRAWRNYGGRGITVCDRWRDFKNFLADMGHKPSPDHSLDRIDNNAGYSKENCKWSTSSEQNRNRRMTPTFLENIQRAQRQRAQQVRAMRQQGGGPVA